jgi:four helix bundle protein
MKKQSYDLEERLLEYSVRIIKIVEQLLNTRAGNHVAGQLLRSGTSPYPNHGEAQAAESPRDFIHKLRISLKELRETQRWLKLIQRVPMNELGDLTSTLYDHPLKVSTAALKAKAGVIRMHRSMKDVAMSKTEMEIRPAIQTVQSEEKLVYQDLDIVKSRILGEEGKTPRQPTKR